MMDGEDLELFERSLRHVTERHSGAELDTALAELGWSDALAIDRRAAVSLLFALQGEAGSTSGALGRVVTAALGLEVDADTAVVLPAIDRWAPPGTLDGGRLTVKGLLTVDPPTPTQVDPLTPTQVDPRTPTQVDPRPRSLVLATQGDAVVAVTIPTEALALRPVQGIDPRMALHTATAEGAAVDSSAVAVDEWDRAVADARLAVAHQLVGTSRTMLRLAREHALDRVQFDRPIAGFQAVRHRLAETLVAVETAEAMLDAAWLDSSRDSAAMAKAVAGREARTAAKHCQQVLAGIGFTTEHDLHLFIRRAFVLNGLFGTAKTITAAQGADLLATRRLPPLLPL
jgi:hypothetical protein